MTMTGFISANSLDGKPFELRRFATAAKLLSHRGHGTIFSDRTEQALFCQFDLRETPPPGVRPGESDPVLHLVGEVRLDNRTELLHKLGLASKGADDISDTEIIVESFGKWGEDCTTHFLGDFAFVLWDARRSTLFAARDHMGIKPFYYCLKNGKYIVCASEIKAILAFADEKPALNRDRIAEYLVPMFDDKESTFFEGIRRLPPAHCAVVSSNGMKMRRYWSLNNAPTNRAHKAEENLEEYRRLFSECVDCRLPKSGRVGFGLSGGLDSSSIVCVASRLRSSAEKEAWSTYSGVFSASYPWGERKYIEEVKNQEKLKSVEVYYDNLSPLYDCERMLRSSEDPFYGPNFFMLWSIYARASSDGARVILDGFDGDTVLLQSPKYLSELLLTLKWRTLIRAIRDEAEQAEVSRRRIARQYIMKPSLGTLKSRLRCSVPSPLLRVYRRIKNGARPSWSMDSLTAVSIVHPCLAAEARLAEKAEHTHTRIMSDLCTSRGKHEAQLDWGLATFFVEMANKASASFGLSAHFPFYDKRLMEFCVALQPEMRRYKGWERGIARFAMENIIPDSVAWRRRKSDYNGSFQRAFLQFEEERIRETVQGSHQPIAEFVDGDSLRRIYGSGRDTPPADDTMAIWRAVTLNAWLQQYTNLTSPSTVRNHIYIASELKGSTSIQ